MQDITQKLDKPKGWHFINLTILAKMEITFFFTKKKEEEKKLHNTGKKQSAALQGFQLHT